MPEDAAATFDIWQVRIILTAAAILGLGGLFHELFLTDSPSWLKLLASSAAISGKLAQLLNIGPKLK